VLLFSRVQLYVASLRKLSIGNGFLGKKNHLQMFKLIKVNVTFKLLRLLVKYRVLCHISLQWHYSPKWTLASSIKRLQLFLSSASRLHLLTHSRSLASWRTASIHLRGLPTGLPRNILRSISFFFNSGALHQVYMSSPFQSPEFNVGDNICRSIYTLQLFIIAESPGPIYTCRSEDFPQYFPFECS
jgi:hypothetical protein